MQAMDETAFLQARGVVNPWPCAFEKALLAHCCSCSLAQRQNIAERETVACASAGAREQCAALRAMLRRNSAFALKLTQVEAPLPHSREMQVECGGLLGVQLALAPEASASTDTRVPGAQGHPRVADVHALVQAAQARFGALSDLPFSAIVQSVVAYRIRRRRPEH
ncbi:MAG: hypothetical protein ACYC7B_09145 [Burkholderiales bacterium]